MKLTHLQHVVAERRPRVDHQRRMRPVSSGVLQQRGEVVPMHRPGKIEFRKAEIVGRHQDERRRLSEAQESRWQAETRQRAERLPKGFSGIWHRLTGRYAKVKAQNEREALEALPRDRAEKDALVFRQIEERQTIRREVRAQREAAQQELLRLREDVAHYMNLDRPAPENAPTREHAAKAEEEGHQRERQPRARRRRGFEP